MKIDLDTQIKANPSGSQTVRLGDIFESAIFSAQRLENAKKLYDKVNGKKGAELSVQELSEIQKAVDQKYIEGIKWQVDDIINQKEE